MIHCLQPRPPSILRRALLSALVDSCVSFQVLWSLRPWRSGGGLALRSKVGLGFLVTKVKVVATPSHTNCPQRHRQLGATAAASSQKLCTCSKRHRTPNQAGSAPWGGPRLLQRWRLWLATWPHSLSQSHSRAKYLNLREPRRGLYSTKFGAGCRVTAVV